MKSRGNFIRSWLTPRGGFSTGQEDSLLPAPGCAGAPLYAGKGVSRAGFAGPRHGQDHIVSGDQAEIAVIGLRRVNEEGWRSSGSERRSYLAADVAALADAGDDNPALCLAQDFDGASKGFGQSLFEGGRQCRQPGLLGGDGA